MRARRPSRLRPPARSKEPRRVGARGSANGPYGTQAEELVRAPAEAVERKVAALEQAFAFAQRLSREHELQALARVALAELISATGSALGVLYALEADDAAAPQLLAAQGVDPESVPAELSAHALGLSDRRGSPPFLLLGSNGNGSGRVAELHIPLGATRPLGVVALARADRPFSSAECTLAHNLATQAVVAFQHALSLAAARRHASVTRAVLDAVVDAIRLVDLDGQVVLANPAAHQLVRDLGLPTDGTIYESWATIAERTSDPEGFRAELELIASETELVSDIEFDLVESGRVFQRYVAPVRDQLGELIGRIFVHREMTAERQAEQMKNDLLATVSHELRTPLTGILGYAEILLHSTPDPDTQRRYLETIYREASRLTALVDDFLALRQVEQGTFSIALERFDLADVLRQGVELFRGEARHTIELDLPEAPLMVMGDPRRIAQVVANLLSNALKYSDPGGTVRLSATHENGRGRVAVADNGIGIPADRQGEVFTKFFRAESPDTQAIGGSGLGLALSREIVEAHGGQIGFESSEGEGSSFWFELPSGDRPAQPALGRVLVIEDDPKAAALLAEYLEEWDVEVAATGADGIRHALDRPPDLVCLDLGLPGAIDGWQVLEQLKSSARTAQIPVVICSGRAGKQNAAALGVSDFLTKPFSRERLTDTVRRLLPNNNGSVLLVDDHPDMRRLFADALSPTGIEVREAATGDEALAMIAADSPDAIVVDVLLPGGEGLAFLEQLRTKVHTRSIPIVALSGQELSAEERKQIQQQAVALVDRTAYSAPEFRRLVAQALGK